LLVVVGPTGVGKTATAVALARRVPIAVVSADSRQVYRGLDAATGKPTAAERAAVPHHLIDIVEPWDRYQAARFRTDALAAIEAIRQGGRLPVVVGGTGLYIRALLRGLDPAAPRDPEFRREALALAESEGSGALHARLAAVAPEAARRLHPNDHVRIVRALELHRAGYAPPSAGGRWREPDIAYRLLYVGLTRERGVLYAALRARAAAMATRGLEEEVQRLLNRGADPTLPALQGIGYRQFVDVARGRLDRSQALRLMQRETVRYAKRQWTWFAREPQIHWLHLEQAGGAEGAADGIAKRLEAEGLIE
jgi:tRNA dimethylallyltransferase